MQESAQRIAIFDLDGTLTWRDSFAQFLSGYLSRHPRRWVGAVRMPTALASFAFDRDRGLLKQRVIRMFLGGERREPLTAWAQRFARRLVTQECRAQGLAVLERHREAGDMLVLLSASPDLYVTEVGRLLRCDRTLCTNIAWDGDYLNGGLMSKNRHGAEKLRCLEALRKEFPGARISAYANASTDIEHLLAADERLLVNARSSLRKRAAELGIETDTWS